MQNLSKPQKQILLESPHVEKITKSHVVFRPSFKTKVVELYLKGDSPEGIFLSLGINPGFFIPDFCRNCIKRWLKKYEQEGRASLQNDGRGLKATGRPSRPNLETLTMDDLKDIIAVQEELIEQLKKKRALTKKI